MIIYHEHQHTFSYYFTLDVLLLIEKKMIESNI